MKQISKGFIRTSFSLAALFAGAATVSAQTSGNLTGTGASLTYSTAPFTITSGTGAYPDGGGALTLNPITGSTPGAVGANTALTFDVSPTLSSIVFNTPIQYGLATATGQSIVASAGGLALNTVSTAQNVSINGTPISIAFGSQITASISGGGAAGLTKTGSGQIYLLGASTYTGGTHFNGGFTTLGGSAAVGDSVLGAAGAGNGLSFNGGSVLFNTTGGLTSARDIFIDAGGGSLLTNTATTLNGVISGAGTLNNIGFGGTALTLQGANTFTGAFVSRGTGANTTLSGNGSLASAASYDVVGTVTLNNTGANVTNRLSDTAAITLRGGYFISTGNASASSSETVGAVTGVNGVSTILVTPGAGQANSLTVASLARQNRSTFVFRGAGLGSAPGAGVANIYSTASPAAALIGGGGGAGTTGISILPFAIGNSSSSVILTATGQVGSSFVTYDVNGIRPLATTEYATAFGVNNTDNVRITAATAVPTTGVTANAVLLAPATTAASALSGGPINVTSGAFLYSPTANVTGAMSAALNFGAAEGIVTNTSSLTMSGVLSGTNGLTLNTTFSLSSSFTPTLTLSGANTYSGNTTITSGGIGFSGTIDNGVAGPFGVSGAIILNGGNNNASLVPNAATTINRNLSVIGFGQDFLAPSAAGTITINGNVSLSNNLNVYGNTNVASDAVTFNGVISGTGSIRDLGTTYGVFNGNNTYSGGTVLASSTYYAGSDTAFGPGTFTFNGAGTLAGVGATARTLANNVLINGVTATFGGAAPLTFTGGVSLNGSSTIAVTNTALTSFNGVVSNGSLTKTGVGAVAFNSPTGNTYTGGTVLGANVGAIYGNNASGSAFGTGAVSVGGTSQTVFSTLAGNFTTSGATSIGGRLSPGNGTGLTAATAGIGSIGTANFGNGLTLTSTTASSLYLEIGSSTSRDTINVAGTITLAGTVYFATTGGYVVQSGNTFDFVDATTFTGTPTFNTSGVTFASGVTFDTSRFAIDGTVIAVPEPGTVSLLGAACAMVGAAVLRRRRR